MTCGMQHVNYYFLTNLLVKFGESGDAASLNNVASSICGIDEKQVNTEMLTLQLTESRTSLYRDGNKI